MRQVLSLGAGVQSTTVALMSAYGDLPKLDACVFADTGWEPRPVYAHLEWLTRELSNHGIPVHKVECYRKAYTGSIRSDALRATVRGTRVEGAHRANLPFFTLGENGERGQIRRQCTSEYKIEPLDRAMRLLAGLKPRQRHKGDPLMQQWFGISLDEVQRMRTSRHSWAVYHYPLVEMRMTRDDCHSWLRRHGIEAPRSACVGCPFRSDREWRWLRDNSPGDWADAIEFDAAIRHRGGMRGDIYIHPQRVPLSEVDLSTPEDHGQLNLWNNECAGICGV